MKITKKKAKTYWAIWWIEGKLYVDLFLTKRQAQKRFRFRKTDLRYKDEIHKVKIVRVK